MSLHFSSNDALSSDPDEAYKQLDWNHIKTIPDPVTIHATTPGDEKVTTILP